MSGRHVVDLHVVHSSCAFYLLHCGAGRLCVAIVTTLSVPVGVGVGVAVAVSRSVSRPVSRVHVGMLVHPLPSLEHTLGSRCLHW